MLLLKNYKINKEVHIIDLIYRSQKEITLFILNK